MNGYEFTIAGYKKFLESDREDIDRDYIKAQIKSLQPFAERTEEERIMMFDSGAFNDVLKAYCKTAMKNCNFKREDINNVICEINFLLDTVKANEIIKNNN